MIEQAGIEREVDRVEAGALGRECVEFCLAEADDRAEGGGVHAPLVLRDGPVGFRAHHLSATGTELLEALAPLQAWSTRWSRSQR